MAEDTKLLTAEELRGKEEDPHSAADEVCDPKNTHGNLTETNENEAEVSRRSCQAITPT